MSRKFLLLSILLSPTIFSEVDSVESASVYYVLVNLGGNENGYFISFLH